MCLPTLCNILTQLLGQQGEHHVPRSCTDEHLGVEGGQNVLGGVVWMSSLLANNASHSASVLGVQSSINLVKQVEGCRVAALDGKDESQRHEGLLPSGQLLHHAGLASSKGHLLPAMTSRGSTSPLRMSFWST